MLKRALMLVLFGCQLDAQSSTRPRTPIDSIVLVRESVFPCPNCPPARVTLRRDAIDTTGLAAFKRKAESIGFYALPASIMGASFCRVVRSDDLMATLTVYHADGRWLVNGYHHCRDSSPEQRGLLALEALVDSLAASRRQ